MWVTRTVQDIINITDSHARQAGQNERLVSIVVAPPASAAWSELDSTAPFLNARSGGIG